MASNHPPPYDPRRNAVRSLTELADWQNGYAEVAREPELPIIDAHHHLRRSPDHSFLPADMIAEFGGHNVVATVFIEYGPTHHSNGPAELQPVGETEFVLRELPPETPGLCAGIVGRADLRLGARVRPVLEAHIRAAEGRFRGIRHPLRWDETGIGMFGRSDPPKLALDPEFREGFAELAPLGLSFDAWLYHHQLAELLDLARAFPSSSIILNHAGGLLGAGIYESRTEESRSQWRAGMQALAACPNVAVKLGGLGMLYFGFDFHTLPQPAGSADLAKAWRSIFDDCLEWFGVHRCLFESNFPVDKQSCPYSTLVNAYKRLTSHLSPADRAAFFAGNAARIYRLENFLPDPAIA